MDFLKKLEAESKARSVQRQERIDELKLIALSKGGKLPKELAEELVRLMSLQKVITQIENESEKKIADDFEKFCRR